MKKILFVCTGNICRSSTAEALLRETFKALGRDGYVVDSCGTHSYHVGESSDLRAVKTARARGVDMSDIRARKITKEDFGEFDNIVAMDRGHLKILHSIVPKDHGSKITLFLDHSSQGIKDVPDPYYGDQKGFEDVFDILETGMNGLIRYIDKV